MQRGKKGSDKDVKSYIYLRNFTSCRTQMQVWNLHKIRTINNGERSSFQRSLPFILKWLS